jgi:hypothetical protein
VPAAVPVAIGRPAFDAVADNQLLVTADPVGH